MTESKGGMMKKSLKEWGMEAQSGFASGVHNSNGDGIVHLRPMNISRTGRLDFTSVKSISDESSRRILRGDILFNNTNSAELVGKTTLIDIDGDFAFSNHMTRLRFPQDDVFHPYMAILLHSMWMSGYFKEICSNHVNQASVSIKRLEQVEVSLPSVEKQIEIVKFLETQIIRIEHAVSLAVDIQSQAISLKRSLYKSAFDGSLSVNSIV